MALEALNLFDQILCNEGETLNTIAVNYLKVMSNEKRRGLNVQSIGLVLSYSRRDFQHSFVYNGSKEKLFSKLSL
jgi:hypothetical protein